MRKKIFIVIAVWIVTLSLGVVTMKEGVPLSNEDLIRRADEAL